MKKINSLLFAAAFALLFCVDSQAQNKLAMPFVKQQFFQNNGKPCDSCRLYTYEAGTTTPLTTWRDAEGNTPNTNPVILDSTGRANIFVGSTAYDYVLKSSGNGSIWTVLNVVTASGGSSTICGSNTQVLFNDSGSCGADSGLTYIKASDALTAAGSVTTRSLKLNGATAGTITFSAPTSFTNYAITWPSDDGTANQVLTTNGSGVLSWGAGSGGCPAGSNTQVQFNDSSSCGGDAGFTYVKGTDTGTIGNLVVATSATVGGNTVATRTGSFTTNNCLKIDASTRVVDAGAPCGGSGSPGGMDTYVQFNDMGSFGGESTFTYNSGTNTATVTNLTVSTAATVNGNTVATRTGSFTTNNCLKIDSSTRVVDAGAPCGSGGGGTVDPGMNGFRVSLSETIAVVNPQPATPTSTDTGAETVTFATARLDWDDGVIATVSATANGLTAGTRYFLHNASGGTVWSFHTSVANAESGSSPVNLTGSITAQVIPSGISRTHICLTPFSSTYIALYDGAAWQAVNSAAVCSSLGTLTSDANYDFFVKNVLGVPTLSFTIWTDDATPASRATQDGALVNGSDPEKRLAGSFRTNSTTTTIEDTGGLATNVGGKLFVSNVNNAQERTGNVFDSASNWTYSANTWRQGDGNAGNQVEVLLAVDKMVSSVLVSSGYVDSSDSAAAANGINFDSTTAVPSPRGKVVRIGGEVGSQTMVTIDKKGALSAGYHSVVWMETGTGTAGSVFVGTQTYVQSKLEASVWN